ncbi:B12-binding domain-containing protein [Chloroflexota bacterium]
MESYEELHQAVLDGDEEKAAELVQGLIDKGDNPEGIISRGLIAGMSVVGERMKSGEMFIPEVLASAHAMGRGMELIKPLIVGEVPFTGKVVMGQVAGDLHTIGRKFVNMILESAGFKVIDLGEDVSADRFIEAVKQEKPDILGLSALITTTMPAMKDVIEAFKRSNMRDTVKIMVGGAPVSQDFADAIGAEGYAPDAITAVDKAKQLLG